MFTRGAATVATLVMLTACNAKGQLVVEDPASIAQSAANQVVNLAKHVEMINNQIQQINTLNQQLSQISAYTKAFGDPSQIINVVGADSLTQSLNATGVGKTLEQLQGLADGARALQNSGNSLYSSIADTTFSGINAQRADQSYRKFGAIDQAAQNFSAVYNDVFARRKALKVQMASTTQQLQSATTDAETQKLTGVLVGQAADLEAIDKEIGFAASQAGIQDIENRNDQERQTQAAAEELAADRQDAMKKMGTMLVPDTKGHFQAGK
jgi:hypothetical protein